MKSKNMNPKEVIYLTDKTVDLIQDALEQAEDTHNARSRSRSREPGDDEDELTQTYAQSCYTNKGSIGLF